MDHNGNVVIAWDLFDDDIIIFGQDNSHAAFLVKVNPSGAYLWTRYLGEPG